MANEINGQTNSSATTATRVIRANQIRRVERMTDIVSRAGGFYGMRFYWKYALGKAGVNRARTGKIVSLWTVAMRELL